MNLNGTPLGPRWATPSHFLFRENRNHQTEGGIYTTVRHYEAMYIVDPELTEEQYAAIIERYQKVVTDNGGIVGETGKWEQGRRRLAYEIKGRREGYYILMNFEGGPEIPSELDRLFRISDDVLRHLIVRQNEDEE